MNDKSWTVKDEIKAINYMASKQERNGRTPTLDERKRKIDTWIEAANKRKWPDFIDVVKCQQHAINTRISLDQ